jgi:hypothetical protein
MTKLGEVSQAAGVTMKRVISQVSRSPQKLVKTFTLTKRRHLNLEDKEENPSVSSCFSLWCPLPLNRVQLDSADTLIKDASRRVMSIEPSCQATPSGLMPSGTHSSTLDPLVRAASDVFLTYEYQPQLAQTATQAPPSLLHAFQLPTVQIDEVLDDDASTYTFPVREDPVPLIPDQLPILPLQLSQSQPEDPEVITVDKLSSDWDKDPEIDIPPEEDELLCQDPEIRFQDDGYPRPKPTASFIERMQQEDQRPGAVRMAPSVALATSARIDIEKLLRGESRGKSGGYKAPNFDPFVRTRLEGIRALLRFYTIESPLKTCGNWAKSALAAAIALGHGTSCARALARLTRSYIFDRKLLPVNPYGSWCKSM